MFLLRSEVDFEKDDRQFSVPRKESTHKQQRAGMMLGHNHEHDGKSNTGNDGRADALVFLGRLRGFKVGKRRTRIYSERMRDDSEVSQWRGYFREWGTRRWVGVPGHVSRDGTGRDKPGGKPVASCP
ncbi:predicted protein [Chaetomium globosum CBS 148.51]|uniref:Uncharacterized protein n=1 Tax=Chaetomium globosum (strain ATCC 6205 / CBS 148.51 / DSM 1962 / NBRC 6347 / NRRL 1970) TaxID=306901 RepID=Q2GRR1_CHAGB|nr:uncharacterized protein CHGG_09343 [Chaetomium globosum CBS 148.51]EAQ85329.1 predicted protein [Chaetomium globosum CBS 148.51]